MSADPISLNQLGVEQKAAQPLKRVPCEVYSRIVGYLRPVQDWNRGKQQEFADRRAYVVARDQDSSEQLRSDVEA